MSLSNLQKFILQKTWESNKTKISRDIFYSFYQNSKKAPNLKIQVNIVTKSIERLIERGILVGWATKTQHKLFITHIKLTPRGKKIAKKLLGQQAELPIFKNKVKK
jgi:Mn-dependent DtxR family transcriptional regulator